MESNRCHFSKNFKSWVSDVLEIQVYEDKKTLPSLVCEHLKDNAGFPKDFNVGTVRNWLSGKKTRLPQSRFFALLVKYSGIPESEWISPNFNAPSRAGESTSQTKGGDDEMPNTDLIAELLKDLIGDVAVIKRRFEDLEAVCADVKRDVDALKAHHPQRGISDEPQQRSSGKRAR